MNVFVVRSPYCYINALEFRHKFKMSAESCYLLIGYSQISDIDVQHFEKVYQEEDWAGRAYYPKNASDAYKEWVKPQPQIFEFFLKVFLFKKYVSSLDKLLPPIDSVNNVILQNIDDYSFLHIANSLKPAEIYCLDEGPKSLWTNKLRKKARLKFDLHKVLDGLKRTIMAAFFGYRVKPITKVTYFSCYDLPMGNGEKLVRHSFEYLQESALRLSRDQNLIYFIGSSLSEVGVVSEEFYVKSLKVIVDSFAPKKVMYIAHRGDSSDKLMRIRTDVGIEVKTYSIPFELQLAMFGPIPAQIASFYSSVLINCAEMFHSTLQVTSFRIPTHELSSQHRAQIESVYEYFLSHVSDSFSVIEIP
jgi:hypothetical protein